MCQRCMVQVTSEAAIAGSGQPKYDVTSKGHKTLDLGFGASRTNLGGPVGGVLTWEVMRKVTPRPVDTYCQNVLLKGIIAFNLQTQFCWCCISALCGSASFPSSAGQMQPYVRNLQLIAMSAELCCCCHRQQGSISDWVAGYCA